MSYLLAHLCKPGDLYPCWDPKVEGKGEGGTPCLHAPNCGEAKKKRGGGRRTYPLFPAHHIPAFTCTVWSCVHEMGLKWHGGVMR